MRISHWSSRSRSRRATSSCARTDALQRPDHVGPLPAQLDVLGRNTLEQALDLGHAGRAGRLDRRRVQHAARERSVLGVEPTLVGDPPPGRGARGGHLTRGHLGVDLVQDHERRLEHGHAVVGALGQVGDRERVVDLLGQRRHAEHRLEGHVGRLGREGQGEVPLAGQGPQRADGLVDDHQDVAHVVGPVAIVRAGPVGQRRLGLFGDLPRARRLGGHRDLVEHGRHIALEVLEISWAARVRVALAPCRGAVALGTGPVDCVLRQAHHLQARRGGWPPIGVENTTRP